MTTSADRMATHRARRAQSERDTATAFLHSLHAWDFDADGLDPALLRRDHILDALIYFAEEATDAYCEVYDANANALADHDLALYQWEKRLITWQLRRANAIAAGRRLSPRYNPDDARPLRPKRPGLERWEPVAEAEGYPLRPARIGPRRAVALVRELGPALGVREVRRATGRFYRFQAPRDEGVTPDAGAACERAAGVPRAALAA